MRILRCTYISSGHRRGRHIDASKTGGFLASGHRTGGGHAEEQGGGGSNDGECAHLVSV